MKIQIKEINMTLHVHYEYNQWIDLIDYFTRGSMALMYINLQATTLTNLHSEHTSVSKLTVWITVDVITKLLTNNFVLKTTISTIYSTGQVKFLSMKLFVRSFVKMSNELSR